MRRDLSYPEVVDLVRSIIQTAYGDTDGDLQGLIRILHANVPHPRPWNVIQGNEGEGRSPDEIAQFLLRPYTAIVPPPTQLSFGGIVLCGGESRRMGRPKADLPFGDETMLARVVRTVGEVVGTVCVVAAPLQRLSALPRDVLLTRDDEPGLGPLAGIRAGLATLRGHVDAAFISSCDVPLLLPAFVERMASLLESHELVVPRDGQYHHPLAAVYRTSLVDRIDALLAADRRRPYFLIEESDARIIEVDDLRDVDPELDSLKNLNTPDDYAAALAAAGLPKPTED